MYPVYHEFVSTLLSSLVSAEPVLPQTGTPSIRALVAVPDCTVSYMYPAMVPATSGVIICRQACAEPTCSVAPLFAGAIQRIYDDESLAELFN